MTTPDRNAERHLPGSTFRDTRDASRIVWTPDTGWTDSGPEARIYLDHRGRIRIVPVTPDPVPAMNTTDGSDDG